MFVSLFLTFNSLGHVIELSILDVQHQGISGEIYFVVWVSNLEWKLFIVIKCQWHRFICNHGFAIQDGQKICRFLLFLWVIIFRTNSLPFLEKITFSSLRKPSTDQTRNRTRFLALFVITKRVLSWVERLPDIDFADGMKDAVKKNDRRRGLSFGQGVCSGKRWKLWQWTESDGVFAYCWWHLLGLRSLAK